jgi:hypothetical protein
MRDTAGITWSIKTISPETASTMLKSVAAAGHLDQSTLQSFERDMRAGRWALNGAPLIVSKRGVLLDGRARLHACINAGLSFDTLVVNGIDESAFESIDSVRKRTLSDVLAIRSELHGRSLGAALRIIWNYRSGITLRGRKSPGTTTLLALLEQCPEVRDSVLPALRAMPLLPHGCGIAVHYLASRVDPAKADQFFSEIGEPSSHLADSPIVQLRTILETMRGQGGTRKQTYLLAVTVKAWNSFLLGKRIKLLRFAPERESFPQFEGDSNWGPLGDFKPSERGSQSRRPPQSLKVQVLKITPKMAEALLATRGPNRRVSAPVINKYARDMAAGRWQLNGQTIKVSRDGRLLDGQHRLEAAKKSKCSFPAILVEGIDDTTLASLDIGRRRSVSDILRDRGESNTIVLASALRWLWMIESEVVLSANSSPTNGELLDVLSKYPNVRDSIRQITTIRDIMGSGIAAALHQTFSVKDAASADAFFGRLIDGVQLAEDSPIRHLRERLMRTRASTRIRLAEAERVALTIKAWNSFREGRPMQLLVWRNRGTGREPLPTVV